MTGRVLYTAPTEEPVTLAEAQDWLRVEPTDHATLLTALIKTARLQIEAFLTRALVSQVWDFYYDRFCDPLEIPLAPLSAVGSVKYLDTDGVLQTLSTDIYDVDTASFVGAARLAYGEAWPSIQPVKNAIVIRATVGYGTASSVPEDIKTALKMWVGALFDDPNAKMPEGVQALLWPYRVMSF